MIFILYINKDKPAKQINEKQCCQKSWLDSQNSVSIDVDYYFRAIGP